jgi:CHASE3 domain sensor protein
LRSPVSWGFVLLSYVGIFVVLGYTEYSADKQAARTAASTRVAAENIRAESEARERGLCTVVINVNKNAVFRYNTERQNLDSTLTYLREAAITGESPELTSRIRQNLPITKQRVEDARRGVTATRVPAFCRQYENTSSPGSDRAQP